MDKFALKPYANGGY